MAVARRLRRARLAGLALGLCVGAPRRSRRRPGHGPPATGRTRPRRPTSTGRPRGGASPGRRAIPRRAATSSRSSSATAATRCGARASRRRATRRGSGPSCRPWRRCIRPEFFAESIINPSAVVERNHGYAASDGSSKMPSYGDSLTLQETIDLVAYLTAAPAAGGLGARGRRPRRSHDALRRLPGRVSSAPAGWPRPRARGRCRGGGLRGAGRSGASRQRPSPRTSGGVRSARSRPGRATRTSATELGAERPEARDDLVRRERRPGRPLRVFLGAIAPERRALLGQEAPEPLEEDGVVTRQVGEVLPGRPLVRPRPRLEHGRRGPTKDRLERLELGLEAGEQRDWNRHGAGSPPRRVRSPAGSRRAKGRERRARRPVASAYVGPIARRSSRLPTTSRNVAKPNEPSTIPRSSCTAAAPP